MRLAIFACAALLLTGPVHGFAQSGHVDLITGPDGVKWGPAPTLPAGAQMAVLSGDPSKDGPFVLRLKMPADYKVPAHSHPTAEHVTVLSGNFHAGMGDKLDTSKGQALQPGGFVAMPANMHHFAWTTSETVLQVHGTGPFAIVYVDPAEDPRKK
jgi:anti-sigma factor ChrR (cupin superfamily)